MEIARAVRTLVQYRGLVSQLERWFGMPILMLGAAVPPMSLLGWAFPSQLRSCMSLVQMPQGHPNPVSAFSGLPQDPKTWVHEPLHGPVVTMRANSQWPTASMVHILSSPCQSWILLFEALRAQSLHMEVFKRHVSLTVDDSLTLLPGFPVFALGSSW